MTAEAASISFVDILTMSAGVLAAFALVAWAFGKILFRMFSDRMDDIDGKDGSISMLRQHVDDQVESFRRADTHLRDEVHQIASRVNALETKSVSEREVRSIMGETLKPISDSLNTMNSAMTQFMAEQRTRDNTIQETLNKLGASVAVLHDRDKRRQQDALRTRVAHDTE